MDCSKKIIIDQIYEDSMKTKFSSADNYFILAMLIVFLTGLNGRTLAQLNFYQQLPAGLAGNTSTKYMAALDNESAIEKNYWLPTVEVVGLNYGVWAYHKYLICSDKIVK